MKKTFILLFIIVLTRSPSHLLTEALCVRYLYPERPRCRLPLSCAPHPRLEGLSCDLSGLFRWHSSTVAEDIRVQRVLSFSRMGSRCIRTVSGGHISPQIFVGFVLLQWFLECWVLSGAGGESDYSCSLPPSPSCQIQQVLLSSLSHFSFLFFVATVLAVFSFLRVLCLVSLPATFLLFSST